MNENYPNFNRSFLETLNFEGKFSDHSFDPGGMTMYGVTKKAYEQWRLMKQDPIVLTADIMLSWKKEDVYDFYKEMYWDKIYGDNLENPINFAIYDFAVNSGVMRAATIAQFVVGVKADGFIGPVTNAAINDMDKATFIEEYCNRRQVFLKQLKTFNIFGRGWTRRVNRVKRICMEDIEKNG